MKSRFATVKRPFLALTALAMLVIATGLMPAHAVTHNNLSFSGTTGQIRARSVFQDTKGTTLLQQGDPNIIAGNPNRTVGDVPALKGEVFATACPGVATDCLRTLANNAVAVNPTAGADTKYHVGETNIIVNEVAGFRKGDTLLIGSPNCNYPTLGRTCKKFIPGYGNVNEQPSGEVVHVSGGDVGLDNSGPGVLELSTGLTLEHLEGSTVVKLPTLYQGQQMRVDVPHTALLNCDTLLTTCNPNDVSVKADFLGESASHNLSAQSRPLALNRDLANGPFTTSVPASCGASNGCQAGFTSFYIPKDITTTATVGSTFSVDTADTWYSVIVTATDTVTGKIVADGIYRFKLNPVTITNVKAEDPESPAAVGQNGTFFPGETVEITGFLKDATALNRPVEDVGVDVAVKNPNGGTRRFRTNSCVDTDSSAKDACGGDVFHATQSGHGAFFVTYGGPQGIFAGDLGISPAPPFLSGPTCSKGVIGCVNGALRVLDTLDTGTYDVAISLHGYSPAVTAQTQFEVVLI